MRLVVGEDTLGETEGRVEVKLNGEWGTVCDDAFNDDVATVLCTQMGFIGGVVSPLFNTYVFKKQKLVVMM